MPSNELRPYKDGSYTVYPGRITKVTPEAITVLIYRGKLLTIRRTDEIISMPVSQVLYGTYHHVAVKGLDGHKRPCEFRVFDNERVAPQPYDATKDGDALYRFVLVHVGGGFSDRDIYVSDPTPQVPEPIEVQVRL